MSTPLTDAITALTTYANTVTGESDTTLSDAVYSLASGYGGGGGGVSITDGMVITEWDTAGTRPKTVEIYGDLPVHAFGYYNDNSSAGNSLTSVTFHNTKKIGAPIAELLFFLLSITKNYFFSSAFFSSAFSAAGLAVGL